MNPGDFLNVSFFFFFDILTFITFLNNNLYNPDFGNLIIQNWLLFR